MPRKFLYETAIIIDHEQDTALVDTTVRSMATALKRRGFKEVGDRRSLPYRRFLGHADQIRLRSPKGQRGTKGAAGKQRTTPKAAPKTPSMVHGTV